jgi:hypothetical protein
LSDGTLPDADALAAMLERADDIAEENRAWVAAHAMWAPCVERFVRRLEAL